MRTTVTLEPDVEALVKDLMRRESLTFKAALNRAIRAGSEPKQTRRFRQKTFTMGFRPEIPYDRALQLAADLEDQEILRKLALGK
ncbi:MAG: antitoxin [Candidatus Dormibacteria bacterium]